MNRTRRMPRTNPTLLTLPVVIAKSRLGERAKKWSRSVEAGAR